MHSSPASSSSSLPASDAHVDRVLILYASETGNAQDVAERVAREFRRRGRRCTLMDMEMFDILDLPDTHLLTLITSTHGRGDPPPAMLPLWTALLRASLPANILEDVHFSLFGLGDSSYERFAYAGKLLHRRMLALGANPLVEAAYGDERAPEGIEEAFRAWSKQTVEAMLGYLSPVEEGFVEVAEKEMPAPIYGIKFEEQAEGSSRMSRLSIKGHANGHERGSGDHDGITREPSREEDAARGEAGDQRKPKDWRWARLKRNQRVTREGWWQDVREIELELEDEDPPPYLPASICNLQPQNSPGEVNEFLEMSGLTSQADVPFRIRSLLPDQPLPPHLPAEGQCTTLRSLLTNQLDLRCTPRKSVFEWLRRLSADERERERLDEFLADPDEIHTYATRPSRTILESLADFRNTRLPLSHMLEILPPLRRRQFSIASSSSAHPGKVQLLIALVVYKTNLKIPRRGLCSSWLEELPIGTRIPIQISPPTLHLPLDPTTPIILVGPGTGVAPMRAFVEERVKQGAGKNTILYFGCRSASADLYYADEWERYRSLGVRIRVAASRDQEEKVYVQHLIREDRQLVREWLLDRAGWLYISGSSNAMPREVREAVAWCLVDENGDGMNEEDAKAYVDGMFDEGRGGEESW